jgi:hypothetical protein
VVLVLMLAAVLVISSACREEQSVQSSASRPLSSSVAAAVKNAKASKRTHAEISEVVGKDTESTLADVLASSSMLIVLPLRARAELTDGGSILTWQYFEVIEWLQRKEPPRHRDVCKGVDQPSAAPGSGSVVIGLAKGTVEIDGIKVTVSTESVVTFDHGQRYLLLAFECANNRLLLPYTYNSIFKVSPDGRLSLPPFNYVGIAPFIRGILDLSTTSELARHIKAVNR